MPQSFAPPSAAPPPSEALAPTEGFCSSATPTPETDQLLTGKSVSAGDDLGFVVTVNAAFGSDARYLLNPDYLPDERSTAVWRLIRPDGSAAMVGKVTLTAKGATLRRSLQQNHAAALSEAVAIHIQQVDPQELDDWRAAWMAFERPLHMKKLPRDAFEILEDYEHECRSASDAVTTLVTQMVPHLPAEIVAAAQAAYEANEEALAAMTPDADTLISQLAEERAYVERLRLELETKDEHHAAEVAALKAAHAVELDELRRRSIMLAALMEQPEINYAEEINPA
jgi:hypothetical protein